MRVARMANAVLDKVGEVVNADGTPLRLPLTGQAVMRTQAKRLDAAAWNTTSAPVLSIQYRLAEAMDFVELDTTQRISAEGILPATGVPYNVAGLYEARLYVVTAGPSGARGDLALFADSDVNA